MAKLICLGIGLLIGGFVVAVFMFMYFRKRMIQYKRTIRRLKQKLEL